MKKLFKWGFRLLLLLIALVVALVLFRDSIAKAAAERHLRSATGMDVTIGRVTIGLKSPTITIQNLVLMNTADYGGSRFLDVPDFHIEYDLAGLLSRRIYLKLLRFNLGEIHIVQNKNGKTNLQALGDRTRQRKQTGTPTESKPGFQGIETVNLSIGRFKYTSYKTPANNQEVWVGVRNETVKNVKSTKDLEPLIARIALQKGVPIIAEIYYKQGAPLLNQAPGTIDGEVQKKVDGPAQPLKNENN
jgi:uncharacterized protein involved in outer membrane biogenesis